MKGLGLGCHNKGQLSVVNCQGTTQTKDKGQNTDQGTATGTTSAF